MDKTSYALDLYCGVTIYTALKEDTVVKYMTGLLQELRKQAPDFDTAVSLYSGVCSELYRSEARASLPDYLFDKILRDENVYSLLCANNEYVRIPLVIKKAVEFDLNAFYLLSIITSDEVKTAMTMVFPEKADIISLLPAYYSDSKQYKVSGKWGADLITIGEFHRRNGVSIFTKYHAFYLDHTHQVTPIRNFKPLSLDHLKKCDMEKQKVIQNTLSFLAKKPANNVLLYGDRGTGKSTMVKALLHEYHSRGLRMIQIAKEDIVHLYEVLRYIEAIPLRFIIFIDDLTFAENDEGFNTLKAVLEGSLNEMPPNVLIYATSNRRHLIKETFTGREGDELHASDTRDESASLADRFGLTVTFLRPNLPDFLEIVLAIAKERGIDVAEETLRKGASAFAVRKGSRSGRVARQYIDDVEGRLSMDLPL